VQPIVTHRPNAYSLGADAALKTLFSTTSTTFCEVFHDPIRNFASSPGESIQEIRRLGFVIADQFEVDIDPEPSPQIVDWDLLDSQRLGLFP